MSDDVLSRTAGALDLMIGRRDAGWLRLDISADGFWNSFLAIPVCGPALLVIFLSYSRMLADADIETSAGSTVAVLAGVALVNWLLSILAIIVLARLLGLSQRTSHLVVAVNWGSVAIAYGRAVPSALLLLFGPLPALSVLLLIVEIVTLVLYWRVLSAGTETNATAPTVIFIVTVALGHAFTVAAQSSFGLAPIAG